jgi:bifunctional UDP-N-acetylglucosamine pyrophosphorylase/glucosamine-1-phosphate N-acetyltransferase
MQAVILAAGRGKRMGVLTETTPKPLLRAGDKTLIEYKLDELPDEVTEIIIVVGYLEHTIREYLGNRYGNKTIRYAQQLELNGTAGAVLAAKDMLGDRFLVMMGDDIYSREDIAECLKYDFAVCGKNVRNAEYGGELLLDKNMHLIGINEPKHFIENGYRNSGLYMLHKRFFDYDMLPVGDTGEFGIPHTLVSCAKKEKVTVVTTDHLWVQITDQNDIAEYEEYLKGKN